MILFFYGAACAVGGEIRLRGVSLQWEASDNKQELDLRGSRLASFHETRELWTQGKLNWTTAELSLRNATEGGGRAVGRLTDRCNMTQHMSKINRFGNTLELHGTAGKPSESWPHQN